jgi:hypothetical protein
MKKKNTKIMLIVSILVALLTILAFVFFFKVIGNKNEHASKVLVTLADKVADKENAEILTKKFTELESTYQNLNNYFIDSSKIDTYVDYLEKLGIENNTELAVKNVEVSSQDKNMINFKILITGDFSNVMKVIYLLENTPYRVNLTQSFINKETKVTEEIIKATKGNKETKKEITTSVWLADVSFSILSLLQQ